MCGLAVVKGRLHALPDGGQLRQAQHAHQPQEADKLHLGAGGTLNAYMPGREQIDRS